MKPCHDIKARRLGLISGLLLTISVILSACAPAVQDPSPDPGQSSAPPTTQPPQDADPETAVWSLDIVTDTAYEETGYFSEGYCPVKVDGLWGIIDLRGEYVIEPQYENLGQRVIDGMITFCTGTNGDASSDPHTHKDGKCGLMDINGNVIIEPMDIPVVEGAYDYMHVVFYDRDGYFVYQETDGTFTAFDLNGNLVDSYAYDPEQDSEQGRYIPYGDDSVDPFMYRWGIKDTSGSEVINAMYSYIFPVGGSGLFLANIGGENATEGVQGGIWVVLDETGALIRTIGMGEVYIDPFSSPGDYSAKLSIGDSWYILIPKEVRDGEYLLDGIVELCDDTLTTLVWKYNYKYLLSCASRIDFSGSPCASLSDLDMDSVPELMLWSEMPDGTRVLDNVFTIRAGVIAPVRATSLYAAVTAQVYNDTLTNTRLLISRYIDEYGGITYYKINFDPIGLKLSATALKSAAGADYIGDSDGFKKALQALYDWEENEFKQRYDLIYDTSSGSKAYIKGTGDWPLFSESDASILVESFSSKKA